MRVPPLSWAHVDRASEKCFTVIGTSKVGRAVLMGVASDGRGCRPQFRRLFSHYNPPLPQKARVGQDGSVFNQMRCVHEFIRRTWLLTNLSALDMVRVPHRPKTQTLKPRKSPHRRESAFPPISMGLNAFHLGICSFSFWFSHLNVYIECQNSGII